MEMQKKIQQDRDEERRWITEAFWQELEREWEKIEEANWMLEEERIRYMNEKLQLESKLKEKEESHRWSVSILFKDEDPWFDQRVSFDVDFSSVEWRLSNSGDEFNFFDNSN